MGAWGTAAFENDDALDWTSELAESEDLDFLQWSLEPEAIEGDDGDYLEAPEGVGIVCAAAVVAAGVDGNAAGLPEEAAEWLAAHRTLDFASLAPSARAGLARVLDEGSELKELWEENEEDFPAWRHSLVEIHGRLGT
jgi:hypothetical protein